MPAVMKCVKSTFSGVLATGQFSSELFSFRNGEVTSGSALLTRLELAFLALVAWVGRDDPSTQLHLWTQRFGLGAVIAKCCVSSVFGHELLRSKDLIKLLLRLSGT